MAEAASPAKSHGQWLEGIIQNAGQLALKLSERVIDLHYHRPVSLPRSALSPTPWWWARATRVQTVCQRRQNSLDPHSQTGIDRNNGLRCRSRLAQIRVVVGVQHRLIIHEGMDSGDGRCLDAKCLGQRRENRYDCIGRARRRRHNIHVRREHLGIHPVTMVASTSDSAGCENNTRPRHCASAALRSRDR